jgi:hypothetical protein
MNPTFFFLDQDKNGSYICCDYIKASYAVSLKFTFAEKKYAYFFRELPSTQGEVKLLIEQIQRFCGSDAQFSEPLRDRMNSIP